jgi:hypothetical protein
MPSDTFLAIVVATLIDADVAVEVLEGEYQLIGEDPQEEGDQRELRASAFARRKIWNVMNRSSVFLAPVASGHVQFGTLFGFGSKG